MIAFFETRLPPKYSRGFVGGPGFSTRMVRTSGGGERRTAAWSTPLASFNIGYNVQTPADNAAVLDFFWAMRGRLHGFRVKVWTDYTSAADHVSAPSPSDQALGAGDGAATAFQLVKGYGAGINPLLRTIAKPVAGTVLVALDGVEQASGWSVDTTTGVITFTVAPAVGVAVTAGFEFDVPCRFDADEIGARWDSAAARSIPVIPIVEIRL